MHYHAAIFFESSTHMLSSNSQPIRHTLRNTSLQTPLSALWQIDLFQAQQHKTSMRTTWFYLRLTRIKAFINNSLAFKILPVHQKKDAFQLPKRHILTGILSHPARQKTAYKNTLNKKRADKTNVLVCSQLFICIKSPMQPFLSNRRRNYIHRTTIHLPCK